MHRDYRILLFVIVQYDDIGAAVNFTRADMVFNSAGSHRTGVGLEADAAVRQGTKIQLLPEASCL